MVCSYQNHVRFNEGEKRLSSFTYGQLAKLLAGIEQSDYGQQMLITKSCIVYEMTYIEEEEVHEKSMKR
jgi:hypothetical protein